jgi:hypothetical protein
MPVGVQSGQISIVGSSTQIPTANQTVVNVVLTLNGSNQNIYTVTAGKTFYLFGVVANFLAANNLFVYKNDGSTAVLKLSNSATFQQSISSVVPIAVYTSGQNVIVNGFNTGNACIWGIEQ